MLPSATRREIVDRRNLAEVAQIHAEIKRILNLVARVYDFATFNQLSLQMILDFLLSFLNDVASPERLNTAMIALVFVSVFGAIFGAFSGNANPFLWVMLDRVFGGLAKKTYKVGRSVSSLQFRGMVILILYIFFTISWFFCCVT